MKLRSPMNGVNITTDRLYTSIKLVEWLLVRGITCVGTAQKNRKGLKPLSVIPRNSRQAPSTIFYRLERNENISCTSYLTKNKKNKERNVLVLSSCCQMIYGVTKDEKKKNGIN